ncbi:MAG TPA: zinc-ribbon domain-containing protein [Pyrinomonadaceae bacterium]|nr:zinc-ribbon domain-containing protein [Pyrinomonadaceae bacterium]
MYCPRCAAQNLDDSKFCRGCGTSLEAVALALSGQYDLSAGKAGTAKAKGDWLEKRSEGRSAIVKGAGLMAASLLIGIALGLFSNQADWIIIWVGAAGWLACWGVISLFSGVNAFIESKFIRRQLEEMANETAAQAQAQLPPSDKPAMLPEGTPAAPGLSHQPSITEPTTVPLAKPNRAHK